MRYQLIPRWRPILCSRRRELLNRALTNRKKEGDLQHQQQAWATHSHFQPPPPAHCPKIRCENYKCSERDGLQWGVIICWPCAYRWFSRSRGGRGGGEEKACSVPDLIWVGLLHILCERGGGGCLTHAITATFLFHFKINLFSLVHRGSKTIFISRE